MAIEKPDFIGHELKSTVYARRFNPEKGRCSNPKQIGGGKIDDEKGRRRGGGWGGHV